VEKELNIPFNFGRINRGAVFNQASLQGYSDLLNNLIKDLNRETITKINRSILLGLIDGSSIIQVAKDIRDNAGVQLNRAIRIARTEMMRSYSFGDEDLHDKAVKVGIDLQKIWIATLDSRVRGSHAKADGQKADKDGMFTLTDPKTKLKAPRLTTEVSHAINCRCYAEKQIIGVNDKIETRMEKAFRTSKAKDFDTFLKLLKQGAPRFGPKLKK
jgi:SPP1 gp7 family putative phage head morphogenesis protein